MARSLDGAAAALLKMDDLQGRVGTPGALVRKGVKPESSVPAPTVPVVKATPLLPTPTTLLVLQPCVRGAYQTGSRVWQVDDRPPHQVRRLDLPMPDGSTNDTVVSESFSAEGALNLHDGAKGRGIGDCWITHDWTWSGDRLVLVNASLDLWRAQVK